MKPILLVVLGIMLVLPVQAQLITVGEGTARWGFFKLYDATLRVAPCLVANELLHDSQPTQLELCYARELTVKNFVDGASHALPTNLRQTVAQLHQAYRPMKNGDCYLLDYQPQLATRLILNGESLTQIKTAGFKAVYFGIWLSEKPLSDSLKTALVRGL